MPFNGGGGGSLPNHQHSLVPLDGGPLDAANVTVASLNSGSVVYSDGVALQELVVAAPNDELRVSATSLPEWYTPAGPGGAIYELIGQVVANNQQTMTITPAAPIAFDTVSKFVIIFTGQTSGNELQLTINSLAANYFYTGTYVNNATRVISAMGNAPGGDPDFDIDDSNFQPYIFSTIDISADPVNDIIMSQITTTSRTYFGTWGGYINSGGQTTLSTISMYDAGGNFQNGSTVTLYKINI